MEKLSRQIVDILESIRPHLLELTDLEVKQSSEPGKWSKLEVTGHLIDSAINNIGRIIRAQRTSDLNIVGYDQEFWVHAMDYKNADWKNVCTLFILLNERLASIISIIPDEILDLPREDHNIKPPFYAPREPGKPVTLRYWISDYISHMEHHLTQLIPAYKPVMFTGVIKS